MRESTRMRPAASERPWWKPGWAGRVEGVILIMIVVAVVGVANAEDDLAVDDPPPVNLGRRQTAVWDFDQNFDRSVFDLEPAGVIFRQANARATAPPAGIAGGDATSATLAKVRGIADEQLARIDAFCGLTEPQRRKLRLAIESDSRRTADAIDAVRQKYLGMKMSPQDPAWQGRLKEWQQDGEACRKQLDVLCRGESLLEKALPSTLDAEQQARLAIETDACLDCLWRSIVARVMVDFDDVLGLDRQQHENLESLLLSERPRLRIGRRSKVTAVQFAPQLVALALAPIEDERLASIVNPRQARRLRTFANSFAGMRDHIESQGLLEKAP